MKSDLDSVIAPEIHGDKFYTSLSILAQKEEIINVLEIGSSSGQGSTQALVEGIKAKTKIDSAALFAIEISEQRHRELAKYYADIPFVHCYHGSSVSKNEFPTAGQVEYFYDNTSCGIQKYSKQEVLRWLAQDIEYLTVHAHGEADCITKIKRNHDIDYFDLVLIDGSEFTGMAELNKVMGAKYIALDDTNTYKCFEARKALIEHPCYEMVEDDQTLRNGYSIFRLSKVPYGKKMTDVIYPEIHFFTIVLNGMPFIRKHIESMRKLQVKWHWHIIEGVAELVNDTAWSLEAGGRIPNELHNNGYSIDGTYEYLDELAKLYPCNISIYRKPEGLFWNGKKEMVEAPLENLPDDCILWQVDADEIWSAKQIMILWRTFLINPSISAAWFWCNYFVGNDRVISTRFCYAQNPEQEWLRVWRFKTGDSWKAHEPPQLTRQIEATQQDVGHINPIKHDATEALGLVFNHYAYCTPEQLRFKEAYYGYSNALVKWEELQNARLPCQLSDYMAWVTDDSVVDRFARDNDIENNNHSEQNLKSLPTESQTTTNKKPTILIDCVAWQLLGGGILRFWHDLLTDISMTDYSDSFIILDRENTTPIIPGLSRITSRKLDLDNMGEDSIIIESICQKYNCDLFLSTYYTTPTSTPSYFVGYDMIPEAIGADISVGSYLLKQLAIIHSCRQACISQSSLSDLIRFYPDRNMSYPDFTLYPRIANSYIMKAHDNINNNISSENHIDATPYILYVGERVGLYGHNGGYKNAISLARAVRELSGGLKIALIFAGGSSTIEDNILNELDGCVYSHAFPDDSELSELYRNAMCTVVSSWYEGFGIPVIEAQACGCPVICSTNSSLVEVAGNGAFFVSAPTSTNLAHAIKAIYFDENLRARLKKLGLKNALRFSNPTSALHLVEDIIKLIQNRNVQGPPSYYNGLVRLQTKNSATHKHSFEKRARAAALGSKIKNKAKSTYAHSHRFAQKIANLWQNSMERRLDLLSSFMARKRPSTISTDIDKAFSIASSPKILRRNSPHINSNRQAVPDFTVVTACSNAVETLDACIRSVGIQQSVLVEHMVIDNDSSDGSAEIANKYSDFCTFISEPDSGIYEALNKGIRQAKGDYLLFLGSDDSLASPFCLREALSLVNKNKGCDFYYGDLLVDSGDSCSLYIPPREELALREMIFGCLPHQSMIIPRHSFIKHGLYDESLKLHADYEWMVRVLTASDAKVKKLDVTIGRFAQGGASTQRFREGQSEVLAIHKSNETLNTEQWLKYRAEKGFELIADLKAQNIFK